MSNKLNLKELKFKLGKMTRSKYFPDRDATAGGIAGLLAFFLAAFLDMDGETSALVVGGAIALVTHFTPKSIKDLAKVADVVIKDQGGAVTDLLMKFDQEGKPTEVEAKEDNKDGSSS